MRRGLRKFQPPHLRTLPPTPQLKIIAIFMTEKTLTRLDIIDVIYKEIGLSKKDSGDLLRSMMGHITDRLIAGETVKLAGFGVFSIKQKTERPGRNPITGEAHVIEARHVLTFKPSRLLKSRINEGSQKG